MAEGLLRARVEAAGLDVHVSSAGILAGGAPATEHAVAVLADRGIDISRHVSRRFDRAMIEQADLILAMASEHLREAVVMSPPAFSRTFLLRELVARIEKDGRRTVEQLHAGREIRDYIRGNPANDVADPIGQPHSRYEQTAQELDALMTTVAQWLPNTLTATDEKAS